MSLSGGAGACTPVQYASLSQRGVEQIAPLTSPCSPGYLVFLQSRYVVLLGSVSSSSAKYGMGSRKHLAENRWKQARKGPLRGLKNRIMQGILNRQDALVPSSPSIVVLRWRNVSGKLWSIVPGHSWDAGRSA